ncbi:hypothetical protein Tco_0388841 [Tanacetum coccineum]
MTHRYQWRWLWAKEGTSVDVAASDGMVKGGRGVEKEQKFSAFSISTIIKATRVVVKSSGDDVSISTGSRTTARGRRFLKVREEKRKREFDRLHNYPSWAKYLLLTCNNVELRNILGDTIGNPDQMRLKVEDRIRKKGRDFHKPKHDLLLLLSFSPVGSNIWFKLYGPPSDPDVDLIFHRYSVMWPFILQLANTSMEYNPLYDADKALIVECRHQSTMS